MAKMPDQEQQTPSKAKRAKRVSPELTEFLHMLDSLESKTSGPGSGHG